MRRASSYIHALCLKGQSSVCTIYGLSKFFTPKCAAIAADKRLQMVQAICLFAPFVWEMGAPVVAKRLNWWRGCVFKGAANSREATIYARSHIIVDWMSLKIDIPSTSQFW